MIMGFNNAVANNIIIIMGFKEAPQAKKMKSKKRRRRFFDEFRCWNALEMCLQSNLNAQMCSILA